VHARTAGSYPRALPIRLLKRRETLDHHLFAADNLRCRHALARLLCILIALAVWSWTAGAFAETDVGVLLRRLKSGEDFRVRVAAALELGRSKTGLAREPLEAALDDENAAVRAASAAALKVLGDSRALPALRAHAKDPSAAVRAQIKTSVAALEKGAGGGAVEPPRVLVKLGKMKNGSGVGSSALVGALEQASRRKFQDLPGVLVVAEDDDVNTQAKKKRLPAVMVTGRIRKLKVARDGEQIVYSASVEYVMHRMPDQALMGTVSGSASARASPDEANNSKRSAELRSAVLDAAIASAMRRAPEALLAAVR
jgi:hypothetical protein